MDEEAARRARALARSSWPVERVALRDERAPDLRQYTPGQRVAMVWQLTLDAWASSGEPLPSYARHEAPGQVVRRGDVG